MVLVDEGDVYYSDSDSDDDDGVDRYVFLARQPAPAAGRRHAEEDRGASSANDDDGDATADEEEPERGGGKRKRRPLGREILDGAPPPLPPKRARVELIAPPLAQTPPSGSGSETESDSAAFPCVDVRAGEFGSEGSHGHEKAHERRTPVRGGDANNATKTKRRACGKRRRGPGCEADGDRAVTAAAKAGAPPAATSGRFLCNLCERCFDSYQALGGHVLGHRKKARIANAAAACLDDDVDDAGGMIGNCKEETAVVKADEQTTSGIAQADKMVAVAAPRGKANGSGGGGGCQDKIKTTDSVAEHRGDVGYGKKGNGIAVSSHCFTNGGNSRSNGKTGNCAAIPNQVIPGSRHEGANGDGNGLKKTLYKCKVCGTECPTGRALGGHMRKHRKRPPPGGDGGGGQGWSPRLFAAETAGGVPRENTIGLV